MIELSGVSDKFGSGGSKARWIDRVHSKLEAKMRERNLYKGFQRVLMGILALEIVHPHQSATGKEIEASLKGHHLALVPSSHGLRCMVFVPGCLQYPGSLCQRPGICQD